MAVKTKLSWVLSGPFRGKKLSDSINVNCVSTLSKNEKLEFDSAINKIRDLDGLGIRPENEVREHIVDDILFTGERYSVGLPWKASNDHLSSNLSNSIARLKS